MEQNHGGSLVTSLNNDMLEESSPENPEKISRLEECLNILNKPEGTQAVEDLDKFSQILADTGIFNKSIIRDQEPLSFIKAILPYLKYETYMPGAAIVHYSHPHEKLCIIVKGKAKEFIAKTAKELQNERNNMKLASSYTRHENAGLKSLTDLGDDDESDIRKPRTFVKAGSLTCIMEEHEPDPSPVLKKRARPQYFGLTEPNSGTLLAPKNCMDDPFDDLKYEILGSLQISSCSNSRQSLNGTLDFEEDNVDIMSPEHLEEFKKLSVNYFLGDILKVKCSRTLESGDSIGLECLQNKVMSREAILAVDEVHCICLYQEDYEAMLEMERRINDEKIDFFKRMFPSFKQEVVTDFAILWEEQECKRGDIIFQENEASDTLFVVFQGELTVSKDVSLPGLPLIRKNSDDPKNKKKKNTSTLQIATFCQGYFFQGTNPEILTTQVSSAKAKIFKLSLKNGKLIGDNFLSILDKIKDMIKLSNQLNAERFEYLCQVFGGDESPQTKEEVPQPREKIEKTFTPIVKQFKKVKSIDARTEYGKYFVRKPGQKFPEYMQKLMNIDSTTCLTESNEQPDEIIQKSGSVVIDNKFPLATPPKITQKSERSFNFINTGRSSPFTLSEEQPKKEEVSLRNMRLIPRNAATPVDKMRTFYNSATKSDNISTATSNSKPLLTPEPKKPETNNTIKGQLARVIQGRNPKINNKSNPKLSQSASLTVTSAFETEDGRIRVKENRRVIIQKRECIRPITSSLNDITGYSIGQGRILRSRNQGERLPSIKSQDGIKYDSFGSFDGCYSIREANLTTSNDRIRNLRKW